jgi:hypothetical protein
VYDDRLIVEAVRMRALHRNGSGADPRPGAR